MGKFSRDVFEAFDGLKFTPSTSTASDDFAALLRREHQSVCSYIYVRDDRRGKGPVAVHYWIAPPDFPDDGLDNLGVGYKIGMASTFNYDGAFLSTARVRLEYVLATAPALAEVVVRELKHPATVTNRLTAYREQVALYEAMVRIADGELSDAIKRAREIVRQGRPYREFLSESQRLIQIVKAKRETFAPELQRLLDRPDLMLQTIINRQTYVESLVPFTEGVR